MVGRALFWQTLGSPFRGQLLGKGPYLHQLHNGHQVGQGDFWADEEGLVLQELVLQLLDGEVQFLHCFIELLWGHLMAHKERDHHLPHRDVQKRGRVPGFIWAGAKGAVEALGWGWGTPRRLLPG